MRNPIASQPRWLFMLWLRRVTPETRVGTAQNCMTCVLARWFASIFGCPVSVGEIVDDVLVAIIDPDGERQIWPLAVWQVCLMMTLDDAANESGTCAITAGAVLEHLARMQRVEGSMAA